MRSLENSTSFNIFLLIILSNCASNLYFETEDYYCCFFRFELVFDDACMLPLMFAVTYKEDEIVQMSFYEIPLRAEADYLMLKYKKNNE